MARMLRPIFLVALLVLLGWLLLRSWTHDSVGALEPGSHQNPSQASAQEPPQPTHASTADDSPQRESAHVIPAETKPEAELSEGLDWTVAGHFRLGKTGTMEGATVRIQAFPGHKARGEPTHSARVVTGPEGRFAWTLPTPESTITLEVQAELENHRSGPVRRTVLAGDPPPTDLEAYAYPLDCVVVGRIVDEAGLGIQNALVTCTMNEAHTDESGAFRVPLTTIMGNARFAIYAKGYGPGQFAIGQLEAGENAAPTVTLRAGFSLRGRVLLATGQPAQGAQVRSYPGKYFQGTSDPEGWFELHDLDAEARRVRVTASLEGYVPQTQTVKRPKEGWDAFDDVTLTLAPGATLAGQVVDEQGSPVPDAWISIGIHPLRPGSRGTYADGSGRFQWGPAGPGEHIVWATRAGFAQNYSIAEVPDPAQEVADLRITLSRGFEYSGQVLDEGGQPMPGVLLFPQAGGDTERESDTYATGGAATDPEGRFQFSNVRCDVIDLQVIADGYAILRQDIYPGEPVQLYPKRAGQLQGLVVDAVTGEPIESFVVRLQAALDENGERPFLVLSRGWSDPGMAIDQHDGTWDTGSEMLDAGVELTVEIRADGYSPAILEQVSVPAKDGATPLRIELRRP